MELASSRCSLPHQTGVTERSIGDNDWDAGNGVVENVMVGHLEDGVGARFLSDAHCHHHFLVI